MQTFLPYPSFSESAKVLDRQRLGKQRVEVLQILRALFDGKGWINHPATKMWRKHEGSLVSYGTAICDEWIKRGYKDTCRGKITLFYPRCNVVEFNSFLDPLWLSEEFCSSHRAALLAKLPAWYSKFGWKEEPKIDYVWPKPCGAEILPTTEGENK